MAHLPCGRGPHYNPFRNSNYYVAVGQGDNFSRWLLRLCPVHAAAVNEDLADHEIVPEDVATRTDWVRPDCLACGKPMDQVGTQLFVTAYPAKDQRKDYWGNLHVNCSLPVTLSKPDLA